MNLGSDAPFGDSYGENNAPEDLFEDRKTDRIMAFDVKKMDPLEPRLNIDAFPGYDGVPRVEGTRIREVALFEGLDEYGRLQPLLGAKADEPGENGLFPAYTWSQPTTETPEKGSTEEWYINNFSADGESFLYKKNGSSLFFLLAQLQLFSYGPLSAHPIHLHLVNFEILYDYIFTYTVDEEEEQVTIGHMGKLGVAPKITSISEFIEIERGNAYYSAAPRDMVVVRPGDPDLLTGRGTVIRVTFPKAGRYNWYVRELTLNSRLQNAVHILTFFTFISPNLSGIAISSVTRIMR